MHTHRKIKQTKWWCRYVKGTKESNGRASRDFQGGPVVKNLSYNCRDTGSIPYQETKITALGNSAHGPPQVLSPCATTKTQCGQINKYILLKKIGFPGGSDGESICLQCRGPGFDPWVGKTLWRRKWQPTPVFLPGKSHGWRSLADYSPWGSKESDTTEWLHSLMAKIGTFEQQNKVAVDYNPKYKVNIQESILV